MLSGLVDRLKDRYRCFAMDRRGRGKSGDGELFSIELEFDDVAALARAIGEPLTLFGHSYGAICAIGAAGRCNEISNLVLYEPPLPVDGPISAVTRNAIHRALDEGEPRKAMLQFLGDVVRVRPEEVALVETLPDAWFQAFGKPTIREMDAVSDLQLDSSLYSAIDIPTLLLLGSESTPAIRRATELLLRDMPRASQATLEGQAHNAVLLAPQLVAEAIDGFIASTTPSGPSAQ
jgi:pimeloyl-ACP methyl ester carboxylesterase